VYRQELCQIDLITVGEEIKMVILTAEKSLISVHGMRSDQLALKVPGLQRFGQKAIGLTVLDYRAAVHRLHLRPNIAPTLS